MAAQSDSWIFVSCGQSSEPERELGKKIADLVEQKTGCRAYFAENQNSLEGVTENILKKLGEAVGFIAIMHPRGNVSNPHHPSEASWARGSIWVEQEIAIAAFISQGLGRTMRVRAYIHESVRREGLRDKLHLNPKTFRDDSEIVDDLSSFLLSWRDLAAPKNDFSHLETAQIADSQDAERRISGAFDETKPLIPEYVGDQKIPTHAYQTWVVRLRQSLRLTLDRTLDSLIRNLMNAHFASMVPFQFHQPIAKATSQTIRSQARHSSDGRWLTYVRYLQATQEGTLRYCEKIDRHDTRQESLSDVFVTSLQFWSLVAEFLESQQYAGSVSVLHRIDCIEDVQWFGTFPDERGAYYHPNAILFPEAQSYGVAKGSSRIVKEFVLYKSQKARQEFVGELMLGHLRELCGASIDFQSLQKVIGAMPERALIPRY